MFASFAGIDSAIRSVPVRSDGSFTDDDWAEIYTAGGASVVPSSLSTHLGRPTFRPYPSAGTAWLLALLGIALFVPALIAFPIAVRAGLRGNRSAWLAAAFSVVAAVLCLGLWSVAAASR